MTKQTEALAQPVQEPAGHVSSFQSGSPLMVNLSKWERKGLVAVYTAPPLPVQREPLTDAQIDDISSDHNTGRAQGDYDFARAIEAAHGIGAKP